jgi:hypothetical protein
MSEDLTEQQAAIVADPSPAWVRQYRGELTDMLATLDSGCFINPDTGMLVIPPSVQPDEIAKVSRGMAGLFEIQTRQNKEILVCLGHAILAYADRTQKSLEESIDEMRLTERQNGVVWSMATLMAMPRTVERFPQEILNLPVPWTYLVHAAGFAEPEDPEDLANFANARDQLIRAAAADPVNWNRDKISTEVKNLQDQFNVKPQNRRTPVKEVLWRLCMLYRILRECSDAEIIAAGTTRADINAWIRSWEDELSHRGSLPILPLQEGIPVGGSKFTPRGPRIDDPRLAKEKKGPSKKDHLAEVAKQVRGEGGA